jgi:hypothetical protein
VNNNNAKRNSDGINDDELKEFKIKEKIRIKNLKGMVLQRC